MLRALVRFLPQRPRLCRAYTTQDNTLPSFLLQKLSSRPIRIQNHGSEDKEGRGIFATKAIPKDSLIYREAPFVHSFMAHEENDSPNQFCRFCSKTIVASTPHACGECHTHYCSSSCQHDAAASGHILLCGRERNLIENLQRALHGGHDQENPDEMDYDLPANLKGTAQPILLPHLITEVMGQMLMDLKQNGSFDRSWGILQHLMWANQESIKDLWKPTYDAVAKSIFQTNYEKVFSFEWYLRVAGILHLNLFRVPSLEKKHLSLYVIASFHNHSCDPNVVTKFGESGEIELYAARDILKNEELLISYLSDEELSDLERHKELWLNYGFKCKCRVCTSIPKPIDYDS